jgi:hypothetical protein
VAEEQYRLSLATIHNKTDNSKSKAHGYFDHNYRSSELAAKTETCGTMLTVAGNRSSGAGQNGDWDTTACFCTRPGANLALKDRRK